MKKLIVFITCQRTGSSVSAEMFYRHGMSLGPFSFFTATPENPLGLCEAMPIFHIDHVLHRHIYGFNEDTIPYEQAGRIMKDRETSRPTIEDVAPELIRQGQDALRQLTESAPIAGFKHPASILFWFYWARLLSDRNDLEIIPVFLLRSPSGIAASYARRASRPEFAEGMFDLVDIYLSRMMELYRSFPGLKPIIRFTEEHYRDDLKKAIEACGLSWNPEIFHRYYKPASTVAHDESVSHEVQSRYGAWLSLCEGSASGG